MTDNPLIRTWLKKFKMELHLNLTLGIILNFKHLKRLNYLEALKLQ